MFGDVWRQQCRIYVPAHVLGCKNGRMPYSYWRRLPLFVATTLLLVLALQLSPSQCPKFKQHVLQEGSSEIENVAFNAALTSIVSLALNLLTSSGLVQLVHLKMFRSNRWSVGQCLFTSMHLSCNILDYSGLYRLHIRTSVHDLKVSFEMKATLNVSMM